MEDNKDNKSTETENDEQGSIIELDGPVDESDEQTVGDELDESEPEDEEKAAQIEESEPEDEEKAAQIEESEIESKEEKLEDESQKGIDKKQKGKKLLWLLIVIGLFSLSAAGGVFLVKEKKIVLNINENIKQKLSAANYSQKPEPSQTVIEKEETLEFKSFVIPFKQSGKFTYISLSIIFKLPDKKAKRKMVLEKTRVRAVIYDIVKEKINISEEKSSPQLLKAFIIKAVQDTLPAGRINDIEIKDFHAV